jgi:site-specific DNA-methyltransferase (adenine-specific)
MIMLGKTTLHHGVEFVWRYELDPLRLKSMELEENLKRKDMEWPEIVAAKQQLFELMEKIHGVQKTSGFTKSETRTGQTEGFGVRKLAAMLGESPATTSQDLQLSRMVKVIPGLAKADNKTAAMRTGMLGLMIEAIKQKNTETEKARLASNVIASKDGTLPPPEKEKDWTLYEGDFRGNITSVASSSVDLVFTDLPYGVDIDKNDMQGVTFSDSRETIIDLLPDITSHSYRVLRDERYAAFWFGFNFYYELKTSLEKAGFIVDPVPVVWIKHRNYSPNPLCLHNRSYEQCLIARKGKAKFVRPGQSNIIDIPNVAIDQKVQVAQKPITLCQKFIEDMTLPSATILDMFAGSGSTGVAALASGRKTILFELDPTQCLLIKNRMEGK